jgi:hypothetical protein
MMNQACVPVGYTTLVVGSTAVGFAATALVSGTVHANFALICAETGPVRFRDDGTSPTPSVGMFIAPTIPVPFEYSGDLASIQFVNVTGTVSVDAAFYALRG